MPPEQRRDEIRDPEEVECAGQRDARDAVQARGDPGDLRLVDGEVGGDGAVEALLGEDGVAVVVGDGLCGGVSVMLSEAGCGGPRMSELTFAGLVGLLLQLLELGVLRRSS